MGRSATVALWLVGGTIVAAAAARRVREERGDALRREPFVGLAELARRIQARRGGFGSAVTGIDLRQPFDDSFFGGGGFGGGPLAGELVAGGGDRDSGAVAFLSPGGPSDTTTDTATFGLPANTAPQDFNEAQFAAQEVSQTAPGVRAAVAAFSLNPIGVIAAVVDAMIDGVTGGKRAPGSKSPTVSAIVSGARAISGAITAVTGLPGVGAPGAVPGVGAVPGLGGVPGVSAIAGAMVQLSLFVARRGVEVEAGRRATADPGFRAAVAAEVARQRADPARFFNVLADPKAFPDAPRGQPTVAPEITFAAPRASDPIDAPAAPPGGAPGGQGEPGGPPGGPPGDAPASGPPGGVPGGPGQVGGLAAQGEGPGFTAGFQGDLSLGLSPTATAPTPTSEPDPGLVSEPSEPGDGGGGGGGGGVGAGGGGDSGAGGEGP